MSNHFTQLAQAYQRNVTPPYAAVLSALAGELGVTERSLHDLGVGFAPVIEFDKGPSYGWWTAPLRSAKGDIVGLSLRNADDGSIKAMVPGSKAGLVYPLAEGWDEGATAYTPGKQNWVRTTEAGLSCPICEKPDGCLLSAEHPEDPKAVMCIRVVEGAAKTGDLDTGGNLHIRKPEGRVTSKTPLAPSDHPVVIVEGMTDAAAALDIGLVSIGRPSNTGGIVEARRLLGGRSAIVTGENDQKPDGTWPGKVGADQTCKALKRSGSIWRVMPPGGVKDFREWVVDGELTLDELIEHTASQPSEQNDGRLLPDPSPTTIALEWLEDQHTEDETIILKRYAGNWYRYQNRCYKPIDGDAGVRGGLYDWLKDAYYIAEGKEGPEPKSYTATKSKISDIIDAMNMKCPIHASPPCWLDNAPSGMPHPTELLAFENGILDVRDALGPTPDLIEPTPTLFSLHKMPFNYDPDADCPQWKKFLGEVFPDDRGKIQLLQEWFGYCVIPDTTYQKLMVMHGPPGSGKSTALYVLESMLGQRQITNCSLTGLGKEFGLAPLVGKLACIIGDGHLDRRANSQLILERLKELTGSVEPRLEVRRMRRNPESLWLYARITIACNEIPHLPDSGGALRRRIIALPFTEVFESATRAPDRDLPQRLAAEAPGVLNWALQGLARLRGRKKFTMPDSVVASTDRVSTTSSPITQFTNTCCVVSSGERETADDIFRIWRGWCMENGLPAGMKYRFVQNLEMNIGGVRLAEEVSSGAKKQVMTGLKLTEDARYRYGG